MLRFCARCLHEVGFVGLTQMMVRKGASRLNNRPRRMLCLLSRSQRQMFAAVMGLRVAPDGEELIKRMA